MQAQDLMSHPAITCNVNESLARAAQLMWDHDCGVVAVVREDGKLAGVITDRDLCMAAFTQGRPLGEILVNSTMSRDVISAPLNLDIMAVAKLMAEHQVRRVPIVDADRRPLGMISLNDLAIECVSPDTLMKNGDVARTLASVCRHREAQPRAA